MRPRRTAPLSSISACRPGRTVTRGGSTVRLEQEPEQRQQSQYRSNEITVGSGKCPGGRQVWRDHAGHQKRKADHAKTMQQDERLHGVCARLAPQLRPEIPCHNDAPRDETEPYADSKQTTSSQTSTRLIRRWECRLPLLRFFIRFKRASPLGESNATSTSMRTTRSTKLSSPFG
jgi:hypothetical protein